MTPEERAKAVVEYFAASLPYTMHSELEKIVTRAIRRALGQQLAELEKMAEASAEYALGRGKTGKGRDEAAMRVHDHWANRFRRMRNDISPPSKASVFHGT